MQNRIVFGPGGRPLSEKSTLEEIRARFDADVDRFSCLETGQQAAFDAPLVLELVAKSAAARLRPGAPVLDLGCGAGNFTLRLLQEAGPLDCHLADLSQPMLDRAGERLRAAGIAAPKLFQSDMRKLEFAPSSFDCILAGAVLHHLRDDADWRGFFARLHQWLKPGGRLYVADFIIFEAPEVMALAMDRYAQHLESIGGETYRDKVFAYVEREDSPRSLPFQLELLRQTGFAAWDVLHRHGICACYYGQK
jgi:tRNA (cmo5U34)-methyltransferase